MFLVTLIPDKTIILDDKNPPWMNDKMKKINLEEKLAASNTKQILQSWLCSVKACNNIYQIQRILLNLNTMNASPSLRNLMTMERQLKLTGQS